MPGRDGRVNVAILAVPEVTASALFGMFDLFSSPGRDWSFIVAGSAGEQRMRPYVVARDTADFQAANGIWVEPDRDFSDCPQPDIVCIPGSIRTATSLDIPRLCRDTGPPSRRVLCF